MHSALIEIEATRLVENKEAVDQPLTAELSSSLGSFVVINQHI